MCLRILMSALFCLCAAPVTAVTLDIKHFLPEAPVTGTVRIAEVSAAPQAGRCVIDLDFTLPNLMTELDRYAKSGGNHGSSRNRLYWVGSTRLVSASGGVINLASRARYESWAYARLFGNDAKTRLLEDTKNLDLRVTTSWDNADDRLIIIGQITDVRGLGADIENSLGVRDPKRLELNLSDSETLVDLMPRLEAQPEFAATPNNSGLTLRLRVSALLPELKFSAAPWMNFLVVDSCLLFQTAINDNPDVATEFLKSLASKL